MDITSLEDPNDHTQMITLVDTSALDEGEGSLDPPLIHHVLDGTTTVQVIN